MSPLLAQLEARVDHARDRHSGTIAVPRKELVALLIRMHELEKEPKIALPTLRLPDLERVAIEEAWRRAGKNTAKAAELLGVRPRTVQCWLRQMRREGRLVT